MNTKLCTFTIWDENAARAGHIRDLLGLALRECQIAHEIFIQSEPPMVNRSGFAGRTPAIEYEGQVWENRGRGIDQAGISTLVARLFMD